MNNNNIETGLDNEIAPSDIQVLAQKEMGSQSETEPERRYSRIISMFDAVKQIKPPDWLIKPYFEKNTLSGLFAPSNSGKSMIALDLAASVATGNDWHGYPVNQGAVVYIAGEGAAGLLKRLKAWLIRHKHTDYFRLYLCNGSIDGQSQIDITKLCSEVEGINDMEKWPVSLVIVDTVARNFGFGDECSSKDMGVFIKHMDFIRTRWNCSVLLVHHTGHNEQGRARGSSAFRAAMDAEYVVRKNEQLVEFKSTKMKDADEPRSLNFELITVDLEIKDDEDQPVSSAVISLTNKDLPETERTPPQKTTLSQNYSTALNILSGMYAEYRARLEKGGRSTDNAIIEISDWRQRCIDAQVCKGTHWFRIPKLLEEKGFILKREPHVFIV